MSVTAVIGGQWGDEGKGKIVDALCKSSEVVARYQGGANAGHTILVGNEETILHQVPSGILHPKSECILGNGMVIDPIGLSNEIDHLQRRGIETQNRIHISLLAHVVTPLHKAYDAYSELSLGKKAIGTTKRGIGPCYSDKINRTGIQIKDLKDISHLKMNMAEKIFRAGQAGVVTKEILPELESQLPEFFTAAERIAQYSEDTISLLDRYIHENKRILVEGAQGTMLDVDFGSYPFVTSSSTTAGGICTGLGISPRHIDKIIGIFKAYTTRVGAGPFPTELFDATGDFLQQRGGEIGATTRRKRRCGWFDAAVGKYSCRINGFSSIAITKLDVLDELDEIKICTGYENGSIPEIDLLDAIPHFITLKGWKTDITQCNRYEILPNNAKVYLETISELLETKISHVSVGKDRSQIIKI
ncbi:MAG: adenylosuccinate synthase [Candidatus Marinimicrobia bacterium CG08_land_8_20_14_0_20_45_22]|nr:MAG: adenylosuccinate synthase [Candidatus Marinimicrobia bacterium CG08_land_8_20_14_0_20_45_22]